MKAKLKTEVQIRDMVKAGDKAGALAACHERKNHPKAGVMGGMMWAMLAVAIQRDELV
jgi:hypothetical protein